MFWMGETCGDGLVGYKDIAQAEGRDIYNQVADDNLENLGLCAGPSCECLLQKGDEDMAKRGRNQRTVDSHIRHTRGEVSPMFRAVPRNDRCKKLLETVEGSGGEHLGATGRTSLVGACAQAWNRGGTNSGLLWSCLRYN